MQSYAAALMLIVVVRRLFDADDAEVIRQHVEDVAMSRFAADPPAPKGVEVPVAADAALRRLLDNLVAEGRWSLLRAVARSRSRPSRAAVFDTPQAYACGCIPPTNP